MDHIEVFNSDNNDEAFEGFSRENGIKFWLASDLMLMLGYDDWKAFRKAINRAMTACDSLDIPHDGNIEQITAIVDGNKSIDYKLSRFGCYLVVMNGDPKRANVAAAQSYFIRSAESLRIAIAEAENVERFNIRGDISEREKSLSSTAIGAGVENLAFFRSAGYRGMYNMSLAELRARKGVQGDKTPFDVMGKTELAANLFRITQTEEKIRNEGIRGQRPAEKAAEHVGAEVRNTMIRLSGTAPENLPTSADIKEVKKQIKTANKGFLRLDLRAS